MKKILMIFGTRPEAIKMAPVFYALKNDFDVKICVTGQHDSMLHQVLKIFDLKPNFDLKIMKKNQTLSSLTANLISKLQSVIDDLKPDLVLVHGDTTSSLASSIVSFYNNIKVGHIEAGLRTFDLKSPFPEEFNRQVNSKLADFHFAPTKLNSENLIKEGVDPKKILVTGNTVIDSMKMILTKIETNKKLSSLESMLNKKLNFSISQTKFILITGHRRENFGKGFESICMAIKEIANEFKDFMLVYPAHLNPNISVPVNKLLGGIQNIKICKPLDYYEFLFLLSKSHIILTDSGGIQEEAPSLGKPVLVMRDKTERQEAVKAGTVILTGTDSKVIVKYMKKLIRNNSFYQTMSNKKNPYGDGKAASKIHSFLMKNI